MYFDDLNEKTRYLIRILSKNEMGFSIHSTDLVIQTKEAAIQSEDFPSIERIYLTKDPHRIRFQLSPIRSRFLSIDQLCVRYYNSEQMSPCLALTSMDFLKKGLDIPISKVNLRLKLCLINQTDLCSKSISIPREMSFVTSYSEWILIIAGTIIMMEEI